MGSPISLYACHRFYHWLWTGLIISQVVVGNLMLYLNDMNALKWLLFSWHESSGVMLFIGIFIKCTAIKVTLKQSQAKTTKWLRSGLLALVLLIAFTGYLQAMPYGVTVFTINLPVIYEQFYLAGIARSAHQILVYTFYVLLSVHILGAIRLYTSVKR